MDGDGEDASQSLGGRSLGAIAGRTIEDEGRMVRKRERLTCCLEKDE